MSNKNGFSTNRRVGSTKIAQLIIIISGHAYSLIGIKVRKCDAILITKFFKCTLHAFRHLVPFRWYKPLTNPYMELRMAIAWKELYNKLGLQYINARVRYIISLNSRVTRLSTEWVGLFEGNAGHPPPGLWLLRLHVCFEGLSAHTLHKPSCATIVMMARLQL